MKALFMLLAGCSVCTVVNAQMDNFDEYRKSQRASFEQYKERQRSDFENYRVQCNKDFAGYLARQWTNVQINKGIKSPVIPSPFVPTPKPNDESMITAPKQMPIGDIVQPKPVPPPTRPFQIDQPKEDKAQYMSVNVFGATYRVRCSDKPNIRMDSNNPSDVSAAWSRLSKGDLDMLVYDCQQVRQKQRLCDWAYIQLVKRVSADVVGNADANESVLLVGYILAQSGIDFRFIRSGTRLFVALPYDITVYDCSYFIISGKKYYVLDQKNIGNAEVMDKSFSSQSGYCKLSQVGGMVLPLIPSEVRHLASKKYPSLNVSVQINKCLFEFYGTYPRTDWNRYVIAGLSEECASQILPVFKKMISGKSETETVNMILNFVQTAFTYGYDDKIWGGDRPFFPDETIYYPYSDCEDRAILFSQLIMRLTSLDVVLLHYPNHLATAVCFNQNIPGDYVMVNNRKYLVCDPTGYKPIGNAYDEFKNTKAEVIKIK